MKKGGKNIRTITKEVPYCSYKGLFRSRCWIYRFLGAAFYQEPFQANFQELSQVNLFKSLLDQGEEENPGVKILASFVAALPAMAPEEWEELRREYLRLFLGPEKVLAPPWASVYLSKERLIFDENTLAVRRFYRDWQLETVHYKKEPDDHIGLELEFMAILSERTLAAYEKGDWELYGRLIQGQLAFLHNHLLPWVSAFCRQILEHSFQSFYRGLAFFTPAYLEMDGVLLTDLMQDYCEGGYGFASGKTESF